MSDKPGKMTKKSIYKSESGKAKILNFYESLLSGWQVPVEKGTVSTRYGDTFVLCCGKTGAKPLVLLHGTGSNSAMWKADVKEFSLKYRVYAIDIIGECGKSSENRPGWKENHYSRWLNEIFGQLDINNATIIGCSLGGWIATDFTIRHPEKVDKLVLLATAGITQVKTSTIFLIVITSLFSNWGFKKINKIVYGNLDIDKTALEFASLVKKYFIPRTDVLTVFTNSQLQKIHIPVYFIGGKQDCFYNSQKTALRLSENIKLIKNVVLPDTGHVLTNLTNMILDLIENRMN